MIPANPNPEDFNKSRGEREIFEALRDGLPDDYTVFHSYHWNDRNAYGRVDWGEADFTVFHPKYGLLVIEVKSGGISLDEDGQWWYVRTDNHQRIKMKTDPLSQANRTKYALKNELDKLDLRGDYLWIESAVWFPHISQRELLETMPNPYKPDIVLMEWALQNPKLAINNAFKFYNSEHHTKLSTETSRQVIRKLAPTFNAVPSLRSIYSNQESHFLRLTREQNALLDFLDEQPSAVIQGSAGTGKTLLAVEKARRLSEDGKVLFLCFNSFLMEELRKSYKGYNIDFYNLPCLTVRQAGKSNELDDETIMDYLSQYDTIGNWAYKHIVIDEGQDFSNDHIEMLATIAELQEGAFYVFYDRNQLVQRFELPPWVNQADCRLILRRNCRNTFRIATTAGRPIEVEPILWENSIEGETPSLHIVQNKSQLISRLAKLIGKYVHIGIPLNQITILTTETEERSLLSGITNITNWEIVSARGEDGVLFTTARKFKGLESDVIIVVDVNPMTFDAPGSRNLFYVGTSRAKNFLELIAILDDDELHDLAVSLNPDKSITSPAMSVASALKVRITP